MARQGLTAPIRVRALLALISVTTTVSVTAASTAAAASRSAAVRTQRSCSPTAPSSFPVTIGLRAQLDNTLSVPVCIDGQGPFNLLIDTGANATALTAAAAGRLHLNGGPSRLFFGVGRSLNGQPIDLQRWSIGPLRLHPQVAYAFATHLPEGVDGLLGADVLSRFGVIRLDYTSAQLVVDQAEGAPLEGGTTKGRTGQSLPAAFAAFQPQGVFPITIVKFDDTVGATIALDMGHRVVHLVIDSGAGFSAIDPGRTRGLGLQQEHKKVTIVGIGGAVSAHLFRVRSWSLGLVPLVPQDLVTVALPGIGANGLFGADVLSQFQAVTIDFRSGLLGVDQFPIV